MANGDQNTRADPACISAGGVASLSEVTPWRHGTFVAVLFVLFATGWAGNHFAAVIPTFAHNGGLSTFVLDAAFGVYALGLVPSLLGGGRLSDRVGRSPLLVAGALVAALGNVLLLFWHAGPGIIVGRLIVGIGVGLAVSAGSAWAVDLAGVKGATLSGAILTAGFAAGPLVGGLMTLVVPSGNLLVPFAMTFLVSLLAVALLVVVARRSRARPVRHSSTHAERGPRSLGRALRYSLPIGAWVFAPATTVFVVLANRVATQYDVPWLPGVAAAEVLSVGVMVQLVARRLGWGAWLRGVGPLVAAVGFAAAAVLLPLMEPPIVLAIAPLFGVAYGLCLRQGLADIETYTPLSSRGLAMGAFYSATYLVGFGLPLALTLTESLVSLTWGLLALAIFATATAIAGVSPQKKLA